MEAKNTQQDTLTVDGEVFSHVKTRVYTPVSIYKGNNTFLRIAPAELIEPELELHKKLIEFGFPVAQILAEGDTDGRRYYIEVSLGDKLLGPIFAEDEAERGTVSDAHFQSYVLLAQKFAEAQLKTAENRDVTDEFLNGIHLEILLKELPQLSGEIMSAISKLKQRVSALPGVVSHGDLNPYNLFETGVIDFGSSFHAPAGYDLIVNLYHTYNFPSGDKAEKNVRRYSFTMEQRALYLSAMDALYKEHELPEVSSFRNDFIFARTIWSVVQMDHYPELQSWRYKQFERVLQAYLRGEDLAELVTV